MNNCEDNYNRDEHSSVSSSDDTEFMDLPLPPVPSSARAVEILNLTGVAKQPSNATYLFSRMDDYDIARIRESPEDVSSSTLSSPSSSSSSGLDENTPQNNSKWSSSDEETSFYRDKLSCFRSDSSTPNNYLDDVVRKPNLYTNGSSRSTFKGKTFHFFFHPIEICCIFVYRFFIFLFFKFI